MLALQAVAPVPLHGTFDLARASKPIIQTVITRCPDSTSDDEVVVCGRREDQRRYRLQALDTDRFEPNRRAEATLAGDLKGAAVIESRVIAPGMTSNRIMVRLKLPF